MKQGIIDDTFSFYMLILFIKRNITDKPQIFLICGLFFLQAELKGGNAKAPYLRGIFHFEAAMYVALKWVFRPVGGFLDFSANFKNFSNIIPTAR